MTPMPVNPILVIRVDMNGKVIANNNNVGNDLRIVVVNDDRTFSEEAAGLPYVGKVE